jgi:hypothetical protein
MYLAGVVSTQPEELDHGLLPSFLHFPLWASDVAVEYFQRRFSVPREEQRNPEWVIYELELRRL